MGYDRSMIKRRPLVVGNWKMELSYRGEVEAVSSLVKQLKNENQEAEIVVCPSFVSLAGISDIVAKSEKVALGAQDVFWEEKGAYTGEVSVLQLRELVSWCIVGHSERRALALETDEQAVRKVAVLLKHGMSPIICVGETAQEREAGQTVAKLTQQIKVLLSEMPLSALSKIVVAYEPIWAIGTGVTPELSDISEAMLMIRKLALERYGREGAEKMRVIYGGSVNAKNVREIVSEPGVDGVLVGGASVRSMEFARIIREVISK